MRPKATIERLYQEAIEADDHHWRWLRDTGSSKYDVVRSYIKALRRRLRKD